MIVIDTCLFIDLFRGRGSEELQIVIASGLGIVSSTVYLELLQGVRKTDEKYLRKFISALGPVLPWPFRDTCQDLLRISRGSGIRVGLPDIMVLAECRDHKARLMTIDRQLLLLARRAKVPIHETVR